MEVGKSESLAKLVQNNQKVADQDLNGAGQRSLASAETLIAAATGGNVISSGEVKGVTLAMQGALACYGRGGLGEWFVQAIAADAQEHPMKYVAAGIGLTALHPAVGAEMKLLLGIAAKACQAVDSAQQY